MDLSLKSTVALDRGQQAREKLVCLEWLCFTCESVHAISCFRAGALGVGGEMEASVTGQKSQRQKFCFSFSAHIVYRLHDYVFFLSRARLQCVE